MAALPERHLRAAIGETTGRHRESFFIVNYAGEGRGLCVGILNRNMKQEVLSENAAEFNSVVTFNSFYFVTC